MPAFAVTAPHLSPEQHYELEGRLLDLPGVDAFFNEDGALGTEVTSTLEALPQVTAIIGAWARSHEKGTSLVQLTCAGGVVAALSDHSQDALVAFLAACSDEGEALAGLTKRLADDGVHEGR
jgi:hypothetical protein